MDGTVSRKQLKIFKLGDKFFIEDLKSTNPTLVNGELVESGESIDIFAGDVITIGETVMLLGGIPFRDPLEMLDIKRGGSPKKEESSQKPASERRARVGKGLELLHRVSKLLGRPLGMRRFLEGFLESLFECFPRIDRAAVIIQNHPGSPKEELVRSRQIQRTGDEPYSHTVVDRVVNDGKSVRMSNTAYESPKDFSEDDSTLEIRSLLCVPLVSNAQTRGALYVDSLRGPYGFRKDDLSLFHSLGGILALAVEREQSHSGTRTFEAN
jgi:transcriptional regulator with GAF, ATPase, and Fis domain